MGGCLRRCAGAIYVPRRPEARARPGGSAVSSPSRYIATSGVEVVASSVVYGSSAGQYMIGNIFDGSVVGGHPNMHQYMMLSGSDVTLDIRFPQPQHIFLIRVRPFSAGDRLSRYRIKALDATTGQLTYVVGPSYVSPGSTVGVTNTHTSVKCGSRSPTNRLIEDG